jgi:hypothetical protein
MSLDQYDDAFDPSGARIPGAETLPDGEHEFLIQSATLAHAKGNDLVRFRLHCAAGEVEYAHFLTTQVAANILGQILVTLGVRADRWREQGLKFSEQLPAALTALVGVQCQGKKESYTDTAGKPRYKLYFNQFLGRVGAASPQPDDRDESPF